MSENNITGSKQRELSNNTTKWNESDLLAWIIAISRKLDRVTLLGVLVIVIFYNTTIPTILVKKLSGEYSSVNICFLNFGIFHLMVVIFAIINGLLTFIQIKKIKKNNFSELYHYLNEVTLEKALFSTNSIPIKKRKIIFLFTLSIIIFLIPLSLYDWYQFVGQCNSKKNLPFDFMGIVFYSALCIRMPIYLIGIFNFKFGD